MLRAKNITVRFDGLVAVNDVSLQVEKNRITALIGPNGAGKTTFFNTISGAQKATSGEVYFDNERIDGLRGYQINEKGMSRTYQVINLFNKMTVFENVMVGMHSRIRQNFWSSLLHTPKQSIEEVEVKEKAYEWLKFVELEKKAFDLAGSLSYGEQRLLEIVRGLASSPKMILLDEPVAGMNTTEKDEFYDLLQRILELGVTVFMIEHDMKLVMDVAEKIYVLNNGALLASGLPDEVQSNPEVIEAYLGGDD